jgi:zinc protease
LFQPDLTIIVVAGDITPERARPVVKEMPCPWQAAGPPPLIDLPPVELNQPSSADVPDSSVLHDTVGLAETMSLRLPTRAGIRFFWAMSAQVSVFDRVLPDKVTYTLA